MLQQDCLPVDRLGSPCYQVDASIEREATAMRLEMASFRVTRISSGETTALRNGVLTVDRAAVAASDLVAGQQFSISGNGIVTSLLI